jgi:integrase
MTFSSFVETKFIPEHVQRKTLAGQTYYQSMLKHLIRPEAVHCMFNPGNARNARLQSVPDWPYLDRIRLCDLKPEHVRKLVATAFARNYAWQTVKHIKTVAFAIIAHAQQEGCFHGINPVSHVKLPRQTHRMTSDLSMNQARAILQLLPSPEKHVAFFTLSTGMNIQEICNLQWKHVNLTDSPRVLDGELIPPYCIAVRMPWNRTGLGSTSQSRSRNIPVLTPLFAVLADWALGRQASNPEQFVLVSDTGQPISRADLPSSRLACTGRKLGIPWLSWRALCRAHAALLSEFWPQLDYMIGDAKLNGSVASANGITMTSVHSFKNRIQ